jgi:hypothetical protein
MTPTPSAARRLTTHQQAVLIQVLRAFPEQQAAVEYAAGVSAAASYAGDFLTIFKAVGWGVGEVRADSRAGRCAGLAVVVSDDAGVPAGAEALCDALRIYGIEVEWICDPAAQVPQRSFILRVGADS